MLSHLEVIADEEKLLLNKTLFRAINARILNNVDFRLLLRVLLD